ncbi:MAG TPA: hypothetical protein VMZ28_29125 [Kofleriaceae bacterium]|nr:hypothetical protein [Kofleriaceae bacterium]
MAVRGTLIFTVVMAGLLWPSVPRVHAASDKYIVVLDIEGEREPRLKKSITRMIKNGQHKVMEGSNYRDAARRMRAVKLLPNNVKKVCGYLEVDGVVDGTLVKEAEQYKFIIRVRSCQTGAITKKIPMVLNQPRLSDPGMIDGLEQRLLTAIDNLSARAKTAAPKKGGMAKVSRKDDDEDDDEADEDDDDDGDDEGDDEDEEEEESPKARKAKAAKMKADKAKAEKMAKEKAAREKAEKAKAEKLAREKAAKEKAAKDKAAAAKAAKAKRAQDDEEDDDEDDEAEDEDDEGDDDGASDDEEDEDEEEDAPKKKAAMKSGDDEGDDEDEDDAAEDEDDDLPSVEADDEDDSDTERPGRATSARHTPVLLYGGASFIGRTLAFKHAGEAEDRPQGYKGSPVPGFLVTGAVYPMAFSGGRGATANIGVGFVAERAIGLKSAVDDGAGGQTQLATRQSRYGANLRYRHNFGSNPDGFSVEASVGYNKMSFVIDKKAAPMNVIVDVPNTSYTYIDPGVGARIPIMSKLSGVIEAKFLAVLDTGEIQKPEQYGASTVTGFDMDAGLEYRIGQHFLARGGFKFMFMGYKFKPGTGVLLDRNNDTVDDVGGASDRYLGGYVTAGYIF